MTQISPSVQRLYNELPEDSAMRQIPVHFFVDRQGKLAALYAGLLDYAQRRGLKRLVTELVQAPCEANNWTAVTKALAEFEDGRIFSDIGDANIGNVGKMIAPHIVRMSSTRAKARCLRDALNIGGTAAEEFGPDEEDDDGRDRGRGKANLRVVDQETGEVHGDPQAALDAAYKRLIDLKRVIHEETGKVVEIPDEMPLAAARNLIADWEKRLANFRQRKAGGK